MNGKFLSNHNKLYFLSLAFLSSHAALGSTLEEIYVTANKRVETKSDIHASIAVLDSDMMAKAGIDRIDEIVNYADNLHFTESGMSTQLRMRGIGSGNSQGFEQSVAQYVDGVSYGRAQLLRAPIFDLESIEILRGPQNSIFGKDSIAGGVAINTSKPTSEFGGYFSLSGTPEFNRFGQTFVINGAVTDSFSARLALFGTEDDGFYVNTERDNSGAGKKEKFARLRTNWKISENFQLDSKFESGSFNTSGRPYEITQDIASPITLDLIARQPGNETLKGIPSTFNNIMTVLVGQPSFESKSNWERQTNSEEKSKNHLNNITVAGIYEFQEKDWTLRYSQISYGYDELCDCDYTPSNIFNLGLKEDYIQRSIDTYIKDESSDLKWIVGLYLQESELDFSDRFFVPKDSVLKPLGNPLPGSGVKREFHQSGLATAIYGEFSISVFKNTDLTLGGRLTEDQKDGERVLNIIDEENNPITSLSVACAYLFGVKADTQQSKGIPYDCGSPVPNIDKGFSPGHTLDESRSETSFAPFITLAHDFNDDTSLYVSAKRGSKSGGFDPRSNSVSSFEFQGEKANTFEVGLRSISESEKFENGITFYLTRYNNLQISQYDGALGFNVGNANKTHSNGFEFDGRVLFENGIKINYSAGLVDIYYKDFKNGNCYQGQIPDGSDINNDGTPDLCDYTGSRPAFTPKATGGVGVGYDTVALNGVLKLQLNSQFVAGHNVHENLDPNGKQDAYTLIGVSLGYEKDSYQLQVNGDNLTNEYVKTYQSNVPLSGSQFQTNTLYTFAKPPRSISVSLKYNY